MFLYLVVRTLRENKTWSPQKPRKNLKITRRNRSAENWVDNPPRLYFFRKTFGETNVISIKVTQNLKRLTTTKQSKNERLYPSLLRRFLKPKIVCHCRLSEKLSSPNREFLMLKLRKRTGITATKHVFSEKLLSHNQTW